MDVTPTPEMLRFIMHLADRFVGEAPLKIETTKAANDRRADRETFIGAMHRFVGLTMRVGVQRWHEERNMPVTKDGSGVIEQRSNG